ncbi:MAG: NAD(P)-dependent oxidoreductase [Opitutae bacterium]|nr:NAD(P)-dependent oxidoreductase [Opitutae bacterium]
MSDMRVLVTGSTGCIGSHAVRILLDEGAEVFGFNRSVPEDPPSENYTHLTGDLSDPEAVSLAVKEVQPTRVLHLGALQTPDCRDFPMRGLEVNLLGTAYLFRACGELDQPLERFVFASSSAVNGPRSLYGPEGVRPGDPYQPFNLYGYWKVAGEGMAQAFHQATQSSTVSLRLATTYGPGRDRGFTAAMTSAMKAVAKGESFEIPYRGKEHYHFSHDVGAGFARAVIDPFEGYGTFNLLGETRPVDDFLAVLREQAGKLEMNAEGVRYSDDAEETPFVYGLNDEATRSAFPKMPKTSLEDGIRQSLNFFSA